MRIERNTSEQECDRIPAEELYEVEYFSRKLGLARERTREIMREYGLNRPVGDTAANRGYGPHCPAR
jgi:hypothetical protein